VSQLWRCLDIAEFKIRTWTDAEYVVFNRHNGQTYYVDAFSVFLLAELASSSGLSMSELCDRSAEHLDLDASATTRRCQQALAALQTAGLATAC
jgi:PqqD family protein of HPr-rel-A system